jgi:hypothetical protein
MPTDKQTSDRRLSAILSIRDYELLTRIKHSIERERGELITVAEVIRDLISTRAEQLRLS